MSVLKRRGAAAFEAMTPGSALAVAFDMATTLTAQLATSSTPVNVLTFPVEAPGGDFYLIATVPIVGGSVDGNVAELTIVDESNTEVGYWSGRTFGTTNTVGSTAQTAPLVITGVAAGTQEDYTLRIARASGSGNVRAGARPEVPISITGYLLR